MIKDGDGGPVCPGLPDWDSGHPQVIIDSCSRARLL